MNTTRKIMSVSMILPLAILAVFLVSLNMGTMKIPFAEVIKAFNGTGSEQNYTVLVHFRLPRMVIAILIGAGIAVSGAILQSVSRNALANRASSALIPEQDWPSCCISFISKALVQLRHMVRLYHAFAALFGAFLAAFLIYSLAWKQGVTPIRLVLVGIGINAAFALIIVFQLMMDPNNFMQATIWLSGSIWGASWEYVYAILPWILLLVPWAVYKSQHLNVLNLGDHTAPGLGVTVERERRTLLFISVALAGACVAVGGGIAFLGLVAPHLARKLVGPVIRACRLSLRFSALLYCLWLI